MDHPWLEFAYRLVISSLVVLFFGTFWTRRGQTLGMASWRLRVEREDGSLLTWGDTVKRLAAALPPYLLVVVDELDRDGAARRVAAHHDGGAPIGRGDATDALLGCADGQLS